MKPTQDRDLTAVCGLYCGACFHYRAGRPDGRHLLLDEARGGRPPGGYTCRGCRSDTLYVHPGCAECEIRACADARGLPHCGACAAFPCERLLAFRDDGRAHHRDVVRNLREVNELGVKTWLGLQAVRWRCAACAAPFSWYEARCHRCGARLQSYGDRIPPAS